jgi:hypothetical protein
VKFDRKLLAEWKYFKIVFDKNRHLVELDAAVEQGAVFRIAVVTLETRSSLRKVFDISNKSYDRT